MAYTDIDFPAEYFNTVLYTGNSTYDRAVTGVGFQPDFLWIKDRTVARIHYLADKVRGDTKYLQSQATTAEITATSAVKSIDSDGFTTGTSTTVNNTGENYVAWNWKANGAGVSNTDGDITSTVSANTTSGFSIVKYTGTGTNSDTVGHGLGTTPSMIIAKGLDVREWYVQHKTISSGTLNLHTADAVSTSFPSGWINESPTSSTFSFTAGGGGTTNNVNNSGTNFIAYCFAEKKGFSKAFKYTGNGSADGSFTYLGFRPAFLLVKSTGADNWCMLDNKRDTFNVMDKRLFPNLSNAESTGVPTVVDFVSNGFKLRTSDSSFNLNGQSFIGFAIAEHPFVTSTSVPTTAR